jgi:hypothetical protein
LCYLKLDKKEIAQKQLKAIIDKNGYFATDARAILRKTRFSIN